MLDVSSHGRAAPRTKSINVEANLLAERLAERERIRRSNLLNLLMLGAALASAAAVLPFLHNWESRESKAQATLQAQVSVLTRQLTDLQKQQENLKPQIADGQLTSKLTEEANLFVGQTTSFLNSATPESVFDSLKVGLNAGQIELVAKADAQNYSAVKEFFANAAKGYEKGTVLISTRRSDLLGSDGINFDISRKVPLPQ